MAEGFAILMVLVFLLLAFLLWLCVKRQRRWLVRLILAIAILPALGPIARRIYVIFHPTVAA